MTENRSASWHPCFVDFGGLLEAASVGDQIRNGFKLRPSKTGHRWVTFGSFRIMIEVGHVLLLKERKVV